MPKKKQLEHTKVSKKTRQYPRNKVILLVALIALLTIIITGFVYNLISVFDIKTYDYQITVSEKGKMGLNTDTDKLAFGKIPKGNSGQRFIGIVNSHTKPLKIFITISGNGSNFISPNDNLFILNPNKNRTIIMTAMIPEDAQLGEYSGTMTVFFKNA